jgi:hypothetical protein
MEIVGVGREMDTRERLREKEGGGMDSVTSRE